METTDLQETFAQFCAEAAQRLETAAGVLGAELITDEVESAWIPTIRSAANELLAIASSSARALDLGAVEWLSMARLTMGVPRRLLRMAARGAAMKSAAAAEDLDQVLEDLDELSRAMKTLREQLVTGEWTTAARGAA
jgi:hypothetical protein